MIMQAIGRWVLTLVAGVVIGALATLATINHSESTRVVEQASQVVEQTTEKTVEAVKENIRIEDKLDEVKASSDTVKTEVLKDLKPTKEIVYVTVQVPGKVEAQTCPVISGDSPMPLNARSVRLLNDLRAFRTVDLTAVDADQGQDPAGLTISEFVSNDTDIVGQYNELATRHDELVDAVMAYMQRQAEIAKTNSR